MSIRLLALLSFIALSAVPFLPFISSKHYPTYREEIALHEKIAGKVWGRALLGPSIIPI